MTITFQSATSNRSMVPIDLQSIFWRAQKLPKDISSIAGFVQSIGGKQATVEKNANGTITGNRSKRLKRVDVRFSFRGFASVRESTVTLSGNVPWEMMYRVLARLVPEVKSLTFKITNTAARFYLKKQVRLAAIASQRRSGPGFTIKYEPEIFFTRLTIKFSDGVTANIFANGTVVAQGRDLTGIEERVKAVLNTFTNPYGANLSKNPVAAKKNLVTKKLAMTNARYNLANSWNASRPGYYVRPGPNKRPRFYQIPSNPALVRTKVLRAYKNLGVNVPPNVKAILGIGSGTVVPPPSSSKKTTSPPTGMYIRPGPGGVLKLYKIPKLIPQGRKTVIESYRKAGINIPNSVRQIFGIQTAQSKGGSAPLSKGGTPPPLPPKLNTNNKGTFRIDGLDCMRYTIKDLKKIASTRLGLPVGTLKSKADLCRVIQNTMKKNKSPPVVVKKVNFTKNGVNYSILVNERKVQRNSKTRAMNSFKVDELKNMIRQLNKNANVNTKKRTKKELIEFLIERKQTRNVANAMFNFNESPSSSSEGSPSSSGGSPSPPRRNPMNIARNILGNNFTNKELANFLNRYKAGSPLNKLVSEFKNRHHQKLKPLLKNVRVEKLA